MCYVSLVFTGNGIFQILKNQLQSNLANFSITVKTQYSAGMCSSNRVGFGVIEKMKQNYFQVY